MGIKKPEKRDLFMTYGNCDDINCCGWYNRACDEWEKYHDAVIAEKEKTIDLLRLSEGDWKKIHKQCCDELSEKDAEIERLKNFTHIDSQCMCALRLSISELKAENARLREEVERLKKEDGLNDVLFVRKKLQAENVKLIKERDGAIAYAKKDKAHYKEMKRLRDDDKKTFLELRAELSALKEGLPSVDDIYSMLEWSVRSHFRQYDGGKEIEDMLKSCLQDQATEIHKRINNIK